MFAGQTDRIAAATCARLDAAPAPAFLRVLISVAASNTLVLLTQEVAVGTTGALPSRSAGKAAAIALEAFLLFRIVCYRTFLQAS